MKITAKTSIIALVVCAVVGAGIFFWIRKDVENSDMNACIGNLRMLDGAKQQWFLEHNTTNTPTVIDLLPYLGNRLNRLDQCPLDPAHSFVTSYKINGMGTNPACRIHPETHRLP